MDELLHAPNLAINACIDLHTVPIHTDSTTTTISLWCMFTALHGGGGASLKADLHTVPYID